MKKIKKVKKLLTFALACALVLPDLTVLAGGIAQPTEDGKTGPAMEFSTKMDDYGCVYSDGSWTGGVQDKLAAYTESNTDAYIAGGFTFFLPGIDPSCADADTTVTGGSIHILPFTENTRSAAVSTFSADFPMDEPSTDEPSADEPSADEPSTDEPPADEPSADEPSTDEPPADEPSTDEPSADEPSTDEPSADEPSTDEPSTDEPSADEPSTDEPPADEPSADEPSTDEPSATSVVPSIPSEASGGALAMASVSGNDVLTPPPVTFPTKNRTRHRLMIL